MLDDPAISRAAGGMWKSVISRSIILRSFWSTAFGVDFSTWAFIKAHSDTALPPVKGFVEIADDMWSPSASREGMYCQIDTAQQEGGLD